MDFENYPPPSENPKCQCYPNTLRAFFCLTGHMTECHYPMDCAEARCSHLRQYLAGEAEIVDEDQIPYPKGNDNVE